MTTLPILPLSKHKRRRSVPPDLSPLPALLLVNSTCNFFSHLHSQLHSQKSKYILIKDRTFSSLNFSFSQTNSQLLLVGLSLLFFFSGFLATSYSGLPELFNTVLLLTPWWRIHTLVNYQILGRSRMTTHKKNVLWEISLVTPLYLGPTKIISPKKKVPEEKRG